MSQSKNIIYLGIFISLLFGACSLGEKRKSEITDLIDRSFLQKKLGKGLKWNYDNLVVEPAQNTVFVDTLANDRAKKILVAQQSLQKYYKFLESNDIADKDLAFPLYSKNKIREVENLSIQNGFDLAQLRKNQSEVNTWNEEIRLRSLSLPQNNPGWMAKCEISVSDGSNTKKIFYTFWINPQKNKIIKAENEKNNKTKAINKIIQMAVDGNY